MESQQFEGVGALCLSLVFHFACQCPGIHFGLIFWVFLSVSIIKSSFIKSLLAKSWPDEQTIFLDKLKIYQWSLIWMSSTLNGWMFRQREKTRSNVDQAPGKELLVSICCLIIIVIRKTTEKLCYYLRLLQCTHAKEIIVDLKQSPVSPAWIKMLIRNTFVETWPC